MFKFITSFRINPSQLSKPATGLVATRHASISAKNLDKIVKSANVTYKAPEEQARIINLGYISSITTLVFLISYATLFGQYMVEGPEEDRQLASKTRRWLIAGGLVGIGVGIFTATRKTANKTIRSMTISSINEKPMLHLETFSIPKKVVDIPLIHAELLRTRPSQWEINNLETSSKLFVNPEGNFSPSRDIWEYILR